MAGPDPVLERAALRRSIVAASVLGFVGIVWGVLVGSQLILLDGAYAFIGVAVSWLLLLASRLVGRGPTKDFPYGREALTPLVIGVQGFILLAIVAGTAVNSVLAIRDGGSDVAAGWAFAYAILSTIASTATWRWLTRSAGPSDLVRSEAAAWRASAFLGISMVVAFAAIVVLKRTSWSTAAPYVDPVVALAASIALIPAPLGMVRSTFVELLEGAPADNVQAAVFAVIHAVHLQFGLEAPDVQMTKVGSKLYLDIEGRAESDATIGHEHQVRVALEEGLDALPFDVWLNFQLRPGVLPDTTEK